MFGNGNGYHGFSKSVNAVDAEAMGFYPATTIARMTKTSSTFISSNFDPAEWHHTGKYYQKTNYYSLEEVEDFLKENPNAFAEFKRTQPRVTKKDDLVYKKYKMISWRKWERDRGRWVQEEVVLKNVWVAKNENHTKFIKFRKNGKKIITKRVFLKDKIAGRPI